MFSAYNSPCVFEQFPQPVCRDALPMGYGTELDFFQLLQHLSQQQQQEQKQVASIELRYSIKNIDANNHVVSLYKEINTLAYENAMKEAVTSIKNDILKEVPKFRLVSDFFGNTFYVKNEISEYELQREVINRFNINAFNKKFSQKNFKDYTIEINNDNTEFVVYNEAENVHQKFEVPGSSKIENVKVEGFDIQKSDDQSKSFAVLKVSVTVGSNVSKNNNAEDALTRLLDWSIPMIERQNSDTQAKKEAYAQSQDKAQEEAQAQAQAEAEAKLRQEQIKQAKLKQIQLQKAKEAKLLKQREEEKKQEALRIAKLKEQRQQELEAKILFQRKQQQEQLEKEKQRIEEEHQKALKELKEKERQLNISKQKEMLESMFPKKITINYNSDEDNHTTTTTDTKQRKKTTNAKTKTQRRSSSPPPLEEIDDEEINRYNESLLRSPRNTNSIIEDALD